VFTARYALSPHIKQICFVFKGLNRKSQLAAVLEVSKIAADVVVYILLILVIPSDFLSMMYKETVFISYGEAQPFSFH
jgi:hypothetical protein